HFLLVDADHITPALNTHLFHLQRRWIARLLPTAVDDAEAAGVGQDLLTHLRLATHPRPENIRPTLLVQLVNRLLTHHAAIRHDADLTNAKLAPQPLHHRQQGSDVGGVPRPQLTADRPAVAVQHRPDDQLLLVGPVVLAVAVLPQFLPAFAPHVQRRGVEEAHVQRAEQVAAAGKGLLLDPVLGATRYQPRRDFLLLLR